MKSKKEAWEERRKRGWQRLTDKSTGKEKKGFLKKLWLSHEKQKWKETTEDSRSELIFEVNSVQSLLLFNALLAKQCK